MGLRYIIFAFLIISSKQFICAQNEGKIYVVHPLVGDTIDALEAKQYSLFENFEGFRQITFYQINDSLFDADFLYAKNDSLLSVRRKFKRHQIDAIRTRIEVKYYNIEISHFQQPPVIAFNNSDYGYKRIYYPRISLGAGIAYKYIDFKNIENAFSKIEDNIMKIIADSGKQDIYKFGKKNIDLSLGPLFQVNVRYAMSEVTEFSSTLMWGWGETEYYGAQLFFNRKFPDLINDNFIPFFGLGITGIKTHVSSAYNTPIEQYYNLQEIYFHAAGLAMTITGGLTINLSQFFNVHFNILYPFYSKFTQSNSDGSETEFKLNTPEAGLVLSIVF